MTQRVAVQARPSIAARFGAFVLERFPFAAQTAAAVLDAVAGGELSGGAEALERARIKLGPALRRAFSAPPGDLPEPTPAVNAAARWSAAVEELVGACDGFLRRAAIAASLTPEERREIRIASGVAVIAPRCDLHGRPLVSGHQSHLGGH